MAAGAAGGPGIDEASAVVWVGGVMMPKRVIYEGRVQGVGFRYTCKDIARGYDVTGGVRNLADGTVELVACGEAGEVEDFLREIEEDSAVSHHIKSARAEDVEPPGTTGFQILR